MDLPDPIDIASLQHTLQTVASEWVRMLELRVERAVPGEVELALPVTPRHVHGGGVLCGQTLMSAADTAIILAVTSKLGGFRPMTTVQLQTSFLRPVPAHTGEVRVIARVLRLGRSLVFGEVHITAPGGELAAHATTTYALL